MSDPTITVFCDDPWHDGAVVDEITVFENPTGARWIERRHGSRGRRARRVLGGCSFVPVPLAADVAENGLPGPARISYTMECSCGRNVTRRDDPKFQRGFDRLHEAGVSRVTLRELEMISRLR